MQARRPVMLVVLDGWGWREDAHDNAVLQAKTPNFSRLWKDAPHSFLRTSGRDVGLPDGQMGNSEVGHLNIGAGRIVMQELPRITAAIEEGSMARMPALVSVINKLKQTGGTCHLMGLVSPGGVHSHQDHAAATANIILRAGVPVTVHCFTDGRDTPPKSGAEDLRRFREQLDPGVRIGTVIGRYWAMDRDKRWERVSRAYDAIVDAEAPRFDDPQAVMAASYAKDVTDEFVDPAIIGDYAGVRDGDGVICFNFRTDRAREILTALLDPAFKGFERKRVAHFAAAAGMTHYSDDLTPFLSVIFEAQNLDNVLGKVVADAGRTQLRMAETEKYPHVTYFLNGGEEQQYKGEDRIMVPSPKVATYDLQPEMSAPELTDKAVEAITSGKYDLIVLNFANPDMVGHTGVLSAAVTAVETVDACLGRIADAIEKAGGALLVTADHGNCEQMVDYETHGPHTAHTTNPVPLIMTGGGNNGVGEGRLSDLAPTILELMGLPKPIEMNGRSLLNAR